jgi:Ca-activated chloride channel family protein
MSFIWPPVLVLLLLIPVGVAIYRRRDRRRAARAAAFGWGPASAVAAVSGGAAGATSTSTRRRAAWRRRLPGIVTVAGLTILVLSLARPQSVIGVPRLEGTVLLAFDVSGSMAATDVAPTRMEAAKAAALKFVEEAPSSLRIGVVVFSDAGFSTQVPTYERGPVAAAIQRLDPQRGTSLARGIQSALTAIDIDADPNEGEGQFYLDGSPAPTPVRTPVPEGAHEPVIVVLISDGENTQEPNPAAAITAARDRGIRVDTVGIGTEEGATLEVEGFKIHTSLDESALRAIADGTDGAYYPVADQADLHRVYDDVGSRLVVRTEPFELTPLFAIVGFTLLVIGSLVSLRWFGRMP